MKTVAISSDQSDQPEYLMPCAQALLAATLALMTGHAQCEQALQRTLMAKKIRSNLFFLAENPTLSPAFRVIAQRMHKAWDAFLHEPTTHTAASPDAVWVSAPASVQ